jgi:hypothetical protein
METDMNNTKQASSPRRRAPRFAAMTVAAMMALGTGNVSAWIPVQETGTSLIQHLLNQINTYKTEATAYAAKAQDAAEYVEQNTRWIRTLEQYRQALIQVQAAVNSFGMPDSAPLVPVAPNYLVAETCGKALDFSLESAFKVFVFNPQADVKEQQMQICVNIRMMQNRKYNDAIDFLTQTVPRINNSLTRILKIRLTNNDQGTVQGADSESLRTANDIAALAQSWEARMKSYDAYIEVMEANQKVVAQAALKGDPTKQLISDMVKTTALKAALSVK